MRRQPGRRRERIDRGIRARSKDVFALSSIRELSYLYLPLTVFSIALLLFPLYGESVGRVWVTVMVTTLSFGLLALSWDLLASAGLTSLGQALFYGVGGYTAGWLARTFDLGPLVTIPLATVAGALIATALLAPVLRLRGIYFALITLALPLLLHRAIDATRVLGGSEGMAGLPGMPSRSWTVFILAAAFLITLGSFRRLMDSDFGIVVRGVAENDRAVMASGLNIQWVRVKVLLAASIPAAFAGAVMTHNLRFVGLPVFALENSVVPLTAVVVGGQGVFWGATLGVMVLVPVSELLRGLGTLRIVLYSMVLVVWVIALPGGAFHWLRQKYWQKERWVSADTPVRTDAVPERPKELVP
ncbi:branched-chain amino acid ABC transporter permease [Nitriliruptor alkaliphilus]|uniref:branched-chain amino acid ABC transporter permease n=1 Tax=Nitriliruptor alkaliphilus TaxID=427918 RepID=UPI0009F99FD8|nr:branched-chain amino acid ABC transporter permease [Nitriliruptor alkaliphilus]